MELIILHSKMSDCSFLQRHRDQLSAVSDGAFVPTYENFLRELAAEGDLTNDFHSDARSIYATFFTGCQRRYLALKEKETYQEMMAVVSDSTIKSIHNTIIKGFGRDAYERVSDLIDLIDKRRCHNIVMVGCGAFPATLFWLHDHCEEACYTGLDINIQCVNMANNLVEAMGLSGITFEVVNGSHYDYCGVDFVYVANQVVSKKEVLEQVSRSDTVKQVVVREPTLRGELLAEAVRYDLPRGFVAKNTGSESPAFLSFDLLLGRE